MTHDTGRDTFDLHRAFGVKLCCELYIFEIHNLQVVNQIEKCNQYARCMAGSQLCTSDNLLLVLHHKHFI